MKPVPNLDSETFAIRGAVFDVYKHILPDEATAQLLNYLATTKMPLGLLVNFGRPDGVEIKRFVR